MNTEVTLLKPHEHGGVLLSPGTCITVADSTANWLIENGIAAKAKVVTKDQPDVTPKKVSSTINFAKGESK